MTKYSIHLATELITSTTIGAQDLTSATSYYRSYRRGVQFPSPKSSIFSHCADAVKLRRLISFHEDRIFF